MDIDKFDFDSLTDEQFNKFIWSLDALKARLNRVSVEELVQNSNNTMKTYSQLESSCNALQIGL